jgi:hypothetical protein
LLTSARRNIGFWGTSGKPREYRENILSLKTGKPVAIVDELVKDRVQSQLPNSDGQDYLIVIEDGTRLKIDATTD